MVLTKSGVINLSRCIVGSATRNSCCGPFRLFGKIEKWSRQITMVAELQGLIEVKLSTIRRKREKVKTNTSHRENE